MARRRADSNGEEDAEAVALGADEWHGEESVRRLEQQPGVARCVRARVGRDRAREEGYAGDG